MRRCWHVDVELRTATVKDAEAIASIYAHHVLHGTASYELEPPSPGDLRAKIERITRRGWPFLVACEAEEVVGYCYAEQLRDRPAYRFTCENSIYVRSDRMGQGIGTALLSRLVSEAEASAFRQMIAVVGGGEPASVALHEKCGFTTVGRLNSVGWKKGRWLDTVYMQRSLGDGAATAPFNI